MSHVFITGTNRGIGLELTKAFLDGGHAVTATARDPQNSQELKSLAVDFLDKLTLVTLDVNKPETFVNLKKISGPIDYLINNAGIALNYNQKFTELDSEDVAKMYATNVLGPIKVTQTLLPQLRKSSKPVIAQISSIMGSVADNSSGGAIGYRMSKSALNMLNKCMSIELNDITCVVLHPGWVQTDMGGANAPVKPKDSATGLYNVISKLKASDSGKFYDYQGKSLPW